MTAPIYRFQVGEFECIVMGDGESSMDAKGLFATAPADELGQALSRRGIQPDAMPFSINLLYVNTSRHKVLVDTGLGMPSTTGAGLLLDSLKSQGIEPDAVDTVIITHGHGDHIGGIAKEDGSLAFPNARYVMSKPEWEYWTDESHVSKMDENTSNNIRKHLFPLRDRIELVEGEVEIVPGVCAVPAPGHTVGHMAITLASAGQGLLHLADAAHHAIQIEYPAWSPAFDTDPVLSANSRRQLLERAAREQSLLLAYHFVFPGLGRVEAKDGAWEWQPNR